MKSTILVSSSLSWEALCVLFYVCGYVIAAAMGAVFGFFMGSLSQISSPVMAGVPIDSQAPKPSVMTEVLSSLYCYS